MECFVYRSNKQDEMYLYLRKRDDFSGIPEVLMQRFGPPEFSLSFDISAREKLAREDIQRVRAALQEKGWHLQMPPRLETPVPAGLSNE